MTVGIYVMTGVMQLAGITGTCVLTAANDCNCLVADKGELGCRPTAGCRHGGLPIAAKSNSEALQG